MTLKLTCLACGQANRFPRDKLDAAPKCGRCGARLVSTRPQEVSLDILQKAARRDELPLIVDFWADWCAPCRMMAPEFAEAAGMLAGRARFAKLDTQAHPRAGEIYGIRGIPLLIAFQNGGEAGRQTGAMQARQIADWAGQIARTHRNAGA